MTTVTSIKTRRVIETRTGKVFAMVATGFTSDGGYAVAIARCHPNDKFDKEVGKSIAISRLGQVNENARLYNRSDLLDVAGVMYYMSMIARCGVILPHTTAQDITFNHRAYDRVVRDFVYRALDKEYGDIRV